jgi:predicted nucleotidyltransferase
MRPSEETLEEAVREALRDEEKVAAAYLYGSLARGEANASSDVDLALVVTGGIEEMERTLLLREILVKLGRRLPGRELDVRLLDELPTAVRGRAIAEGLLVFERDPVARVRAEVAARMDFHDFQYFERYGTEQGLRGLRRRLGLG